MSAWPGKYVIGLTGNIATGKSVVRKMLEHLGAYGIDADALSHRAMAQGAPGYQPILDTFGRWILAPDGQIDRARLGRVVFSDPQALQRLEAILHPLVRQAVDILIRRSKQTVIVLEAIKLLESPLRQNCDSIIVTCAPQAVQLARLMQKRGMSEESARQRISAQPAQEAKIAAANFVVYNEGSFEDTWRQVNLAWQAILLTHPQAPAPAAAAVAKGELALERGRPRQAGEIANIINHLNGNSFHLTSSDIMAGFGEKAYLLIRQDQRVVGIVGWQVENLVARTDEIYLEPTIPLSKALKLVFEEIEQTSRDLQCEVSLLFLPPALARYNDTWRSLGYEHRLVESLGARAWQEAARESMRAGSILMFKQLRKDRVLRPV
jgi:dephospho-CoA kinase